MVININFNINIYLLYFYFTKIMEFVIHMSVFVYCYLMENLNNVNFYC